MYWTLALAHFMIPVAKSYAELDVPELIDFRGKSNFTVCCQFPEGICWNYSL